MNIIDGKEIATVVEHEVSEYVARLAREDIYTTLAVIQVGVDPASCVYVRNKKRACERTGIRSICHELPDHTEEKELLELIDSLNADPSVHGILVQLPLPAHIRANVVIEAIDPSKDVDGFHPENVGRLWAGENSFVPCTPAGVIRLLKEAGVRTEGARCVIIGRSNIVGKPMAALMLRENATVTMTHSRTQNLSELTKEADILIVCAGVPKMIDKSMIKHGSVIIDVGIHRMPDGGLCGDVDFESVSTLCGAITPVPGGVGPMTIAMLLSNCAKAAEQIVRCERQHRMQCNKLPQGVSYE